MMRRFLLLLLLLLPLAIHAAKPVHADNAFQLSATAKDNQTLTVMWTIKPGYYLYRARIHFSPVKPEQDRLGQPLWPPVDAVKEYPGIGKMAVYKGNLKIAVPIVQCPGKTILIKVHYQGCSEAGFCYPPITKTMEINLAGDYGQAVQPLTIDLAPGGVTAKAVDTVPVTQGKIAQLLQQRNLFIILISFFGFGLLLSLTPCVLPMIPILSSIIAGQKEHHHGRAFSLSLVYVLGMAMTYAIAGVIFGYIGGTVQASLQKPWLIILFSLAFVAMSLSLLGLYNIELPKKWQQRLTDISNIQQRGSYLGTAIMGILATLILSPCVTPALVGVLGYIGQSGNAALGGVALFVMGLGMGVPLLLIGLFSTKFLPKMGPWMNTIKQFLGILMLAVAVSMLSRILPSMVTMWLWAGLAIAGAIILGLFTTSHNTPAKVCKLFGLLLFIYGLLIGINALMGQNNPLNPLEFIGAQQQAPQLNFIPVKTIGDVEQQLQQAQKHHQPVLLDFYADWCISCKEMDHFTFGNRDVQKALSGYYLLRADVTKNDDNDKDLQHYFHVIAPPTIIFFDKNGQELKSARLIGEMSAKQFLHHLRRLGRYRE